MTNFFQDLLRRNEFNNSQGHKLPNDATSDHQNT